MIAVRVDHRLEFVSDDKLKPAIVGHASVEHDEPNVQVSDLCDKLLVVLDLVVASEVSLDDSGLARGVRLGKFLGDELHFGGRPRYNANVEAVTGELTAKLFADPGRTSRDQSPHALTSVALEVVQLAPENVSVEAPGHGEQEESKLERAKGDKHCSEARPKRKASIFALRRVDDVITFTGEDERKILKHRPRISVALALYFYYI